MKVSMKLLLGVSALSTMACAPRVNTLPPTVTVDESRSFDRHLTTRMREAFAEQNVPDSLSRSAKDVAFLTRGGPPGPVRLEGALVKSPTTPDAKVKVEMTYGTGRDGTVPKVRPALPDLFLRQSDQARTQLDGLSSQRNYVKLGCGLTSLESTDGLTRGEFKEAPVTRIRAKVVQICPKSLSGFYSLDVVAERIIISDLDVSMSGMVTRQLSLVAGELVLQGKVTVRTKAPDDELTYSPGPSVTISADHISGDGELLIQASGSNFIQKK